MPTEAPVYILKAMSKQLNNVVRSSLVAQKVSKGHVQQYSVRVWLLILHCTWNVFITHPQHPYLIDGTPPHHPIQVSRMVEYHNGMLSVGILHGIVYEWAIYVNSVVSPSLEAPWNDCRKE